MADSTIQELRAENEELRLRLEEAEQALEAIRTGQVESLVVEGPDGPRIFSLEGADAVLPRARRGDERGRRHAARGRDGPLLQRPLRRPARRSRCSG